MKPRTKFFCITILLFCAVGTIGLGFWFWFTSKSDVVVLGENLLLPKIMSTPKFKIIGYAHGEHFRPREGEIIRRAEAAARTVETKMNIYDPQSELGKFNAAAADQFVKLSPETVEVLLAARTIYDQTGGAFDVTAKPLFVLWKDSRKTKIKKLPTADQIRDERAKSRWSDLRVRVGGAEKSTGGACVDLGGIAKGFAIDLAVRSLQQSGCFAGVVDIGGDVRCFGTRPDGEKWRVAVRDPFEPQGGALLGVLEIPAMSVCTSGNYERFVEIGGKRYTHIINPKTGRPAAGYPSVTVLAPDARTADAWATALSVLGPEGFKRIPAKSGIEAMVVVGTREKHELKMTDGFRRFFRAAE
ncbi:MAG: FAD:protein FMN transferase [Phycisphaerae bacterium]|nr:FAD:protein FMN transferase [Phycisphaerae bacterium]